MADKSADVTDYNPEQIPEEDIQKLYKLAREVPSYESKSIETISAIHIPTVLAGIGIVRPPHVINKWFEFCDKYLNGKISIEKFIAYKRVQHDPIKLIELITQ